MTIAAPPGGQDAADLPRGLPHEFDRLLRGAIDLHVHGQPDLTTDLQNRGSDLEVARLARDYGMAGWALKSHLWPTMDRANLLHDQLADSGFSVWGSITLNPPVGGLEPAVVEMAAAHRARIVFLPTWASVADVSRHGYISMLLRRYCGHFDEYVDRTALAVVDATGRLTSRAIEVFEACRENDLCLATGHVSLAESRAIADHCAGTGQRLLITHPLHYAEDPADLSYFVERGAFVELNNAPLLHPDGHHHIRDVHEAIGAIGSDAVVLTTDIFSRWVPPEPECLRMFVEQLSYLGWSDADIRRMVVTNPRRYLGLDPEPDEGAE
ncbi:hypothetical protein ISU10_22615 [Nocardioides agariphilus]|uniref:Uncharacterized protein n=1 Tax=Nocardioides agariphilus TaxID=433664 RepID=A0A930VN45_9ACTN|nr:DUF6282 family protein [Nocardioides agariphilus]MBF4770574.1 hypothetical protein [Nocardioides agariphilus]